MQGCYMDEKRFITQEYITKAGKPLSSVFQEQYQRFKPILS